MRTPGSEKISPAYRSSESGTCLRTSGFKTWSILILDQRSIPPAIASSALRCAAPAR